MQWIFNLDDDHPDKDFHRRRRDEYGPDLFFPFIVWLVRDKTAIQLTPERKLKLMDQLNVVQLGDYSITITDVKGNVLAAPVFDTPPAWTSSNPAAATILASADGTTAVLTPVGPINVVTVVGMSCSIGGVALTASDQVTTIAGPAANAAITMTVVPIPASTPAPAPASAPVAVTPVAGS